MKGYSVEVMASYISPKTKRYCQSPQDWIAYVTRPDGKIITMAGWSTKTQAFRIANEYILKHSTQEAS